MDTGFWHQKWERNDIAFHERQANPHLVRHFDALTLAQGSRVFLPLCGKSLDIPWLLSQGYRVAGAELSEIAITQLFAELGVEPTLSGMGKLVHYRAKNIDLFAGDIFDLSRPMLGHVDAIYDRAALVALPIYMRHQYSAHLKEITDKASQLLIGYEYDQRLMEGPPFSVSGEEVRQHYSDSYDLTLLANAPVAGGLKGNRAVKESVWLLNKTNTRG